MQCNEQNAQGKHMENYSNKYFRGPRGLQTLGDTQPSTWR